MQLSFETWEQAHLYALGKFIHRYASLEAAVYVSFRMLIGIDLPTAKALYSGLRVRDAISLSRRVAEARGHDLDAWLVIGFERLAEITTVRDQILHQGFNIEDNLAKVTDSHRTLESKAKSLNLTIADFDDLEADLLKMRAAHTVFQLNTLSIDQSSSIYTSEVKRAKANWRYRR